MTAILLLLLDIIMGAIGFFLYQGIFQPQINKNAAFAKLKAKEREELDRKLNIQNYFGQITNEVAAEPQLKSVFHKKAI